VHGGQLLLKPLTPIPAVRRGLRLYPDVRSPRLWVNGVLAAGAAALAVRRGLHRQASD
jgi:hypothetical protein